MLGIKLFKSTPGIPPIEFNYELRCIEYIELNNEWFIAGGDKSGKLVLFKYDGEKINLKRERKFHYKIISMDFILYDQNEEKLGLIVALEVENEPNLFINPDITSREQWEENWIEIKHPHGTPQLVFQPYVMVKLSKIIFSFRNGYFIISDVVQRENGCYELIKEWDHSFPSRVIDACVEFPKYLERTREMNKDNDNVIYLASKAGCILIMPINRTLKLPVNFPILHRLRTIHNSIRSITSINKIPEISDSLRGILGIAGTEFFCLYRDKDKTYDENYKILTERYINSLHTLEVGTYENPDKKGTETKIIFIGDSQGVLYARQFLRKLTTDNLPEVLFEERKIFREKIKDRIFGIVPITTSSSDLDIKKPLLHLALGLGNHEIIFKDLQNKDYIYGDIKFELDFQVKRTKIDTLKSTMEKYIELARDTEYDLQSKHKLMTTVFDHKSEGISIALKCLNEGLIDPFIQLVYWLLSSGNRTIFLQLYRKICELVQKYNDSYDPHGHQKKIYHDLDNLLNDIDKFWIGGESYSGKIEDLNKLISINEKNKKPLDKLIYQACINDRSFALEKDVGISNSQITSICQVKHLLFVADSSGKLHLLKLNLARIIEPVNIKDFHTDIYREQLPRNTNLRDNFIRQIFIHPEGKWGFFMLQAGGIWVFPLERIINIDIDKIDPMENLKHTITNTIFKNSQCQLIARDILTNLLKINHSNGKLFFCDRFNQLYQLEFNHGTQTSNQIIELLPLKKSREHNPICDFDFLPGDRILFADFSGNINVLDLNKKEQTSKISFPTTPYFNVCYICNEGNTLWGSENGDIIAFDFSESQPFCKWTYKLPGAVRFIIKTDDNKLQIGGGCTEIIVMDCTGKIEDFINLESYGKEKHDYKTGINTICQLYTEKTDQKHPGQRILIAAGDQQGNVKIIRIYQPKIYEDKINNFFVSSEPSLKTKVKMRCINIGENSLRRLFTALESKTWDLDKLLREIDRLSHSSKYHFHAGVLLHLVPRLFSEFITQYREVESSLRFDSTYFKFQDTLTTLINSWGIKTDIHCQQVMKILGVNLFEMMINRNLTTGIDKIIKKNNIPNISTPVEMMEDIHTHCISSTLVHMYEEIRTHLSEKQGNPYLDFEYAIDFICQKFRGHKFDTLIPDPLLQKETDVLALIVDKLEYCPIRLCYKLFLEDADITIFHHMIHKVEDQRPKRVFTATYNFCWKLRQFENILEELSAINRFREIFPGRFQENGDIFYSEFSFIFNRSQQILNFSDALDIAASDTIIGYDQDVKYFADMIQWLNNIIGKISIMKNIFQDCLSREPQIPVPRNQLLELRADFKQMSMIERKKFEMGEIYYYLLMGLIEHLTDILSVFCEVTLPIVSLEKTATFLDKYLEEIRKEKQPLPALDNPDTMDNYNHLLSDMFDTLIVGMEPQHAFFQYPALVSQKKINHFAIYNNDREFLTGKTEKDISSFSNWVRSDMPNIEEIYLFLPDMNHEYGKYRFAFLESDMARARFKEKISRFRGFASVLNLYIMAFNGMTEAEMQSRFSHRLFAHQSKEPLLALRNHLKILKDENFQDKNGTTTKEYHERMLRSVQEMLNRCDYILNVRKLFRHVSPELSHFQLNTMVTDVVKNMRKVMEDFCYRGEISLNPGKNPDLDIEVYSDEAKIREILEQLIKNSIKYCIGTRKINLTIGYDRENLYFKISDNGIGIPEKDMPYIFTTYFRGEYGETNSIDGDGLGLWVAKTYTDMLGGEITARNNYDSKNQRNGANFTLIIPREFKEK